MFFATVKVIRKRKWCKKTQKLGKSARDTKKIENFKVGKEKGGRARANSRGKSSIAKDKKDKKNSKKGGRQKLEVHKARDVTKNAGKKKARASSNALKIPESSTPRHEKLANARASLQRARESLNLKQELDKQESRDGSKKKREKFASDLKLEEEIKNALKLVKPNFRKKIEHEIAQSLKEKMKK